MRIIYRPLVSILCRHTYFEAGIARPLRMLPNAPCIRLMQRHRCLLRDAIGGGTIYAGTDESGEHIASLDKMTPLIFSLVTDDPFFASYTAGDWAPGYITYYSDAAANADSKVDEQSLTGTRLALKPRAFSHRFAAPQHGQTVTIRRSLDDSMVLSVPAPVLPFETLDLDLRALDDDRYTLCIDSEPALDFYLTDEDQPGFWGILALSRLAEIAARNDAAPGHYAIALTARQTIWRYVITGAGLSDGRSFSVSGRQLPKSVIAFNGPTQMQLGDQPALAFDSAVPLAAVERPSDHYKMSLTITGKTVGGDTTLLLPSAGQSTLVQEGRAAKSPPVSEIVVSL